MKTQSKMLILSFMIILLFVMTLCFSLFTGNTMFSPLELWNDFIQGKSNTTEYRIFMYSRLPRTMAAIAAGAALAVSGTLIQAVLNNALASPNIIGVSSGAGFFALLSASFFPMFPRLVPVSAFWGALLTSMLIYLIAVKTGASRITLILSGVAISGILSAGIDLITILYPDDVIGATGFMVGSFSGITFSSLFPAVIFIGIGILFAFIFSYDLNILALGESTAASLGLRVSSLRLIVIAISALLSGAAVSFAGLLGFIGLIIPHICRALVGHDYRKLIFYAAIMGASFAMLCDSLGKLLFAPFEVPVGIVLSFLGSPFFLFLLFVKRRGRIYE